MNVTRRRRGGAHCKRNQRGGGTQYYGFGQDLGPQLGAPEVVRHNYVNVPRYGETNATGAGLPGMGGLMRGGRYMVDPSDVLARDAGVAAAVNTSIPCEGTRSVWPGKGGASVTMNPAIYEPTAGWGMGVDGSSTAIGTPIKIEVPFATCEMNPACLKTGGARRRRTVRNRRRSTRRAGRKGRKGRTNRK